MFRCASLAKYMRRQYFDLGGTANLGESLKITFASPASQDYIVWLSYPTVRNSNFFRDFFVIIWFQFQYLFDQFLATSWSQNGKTVYSRMVLG